jgi:hypothetical protein
MRKNNLLNAEKEPRVWGGYENRYQISPHGFRKINYLMAKQGVSSNTPEQQDMISQACASQYLLKGTGTVREMFGPELVKILTHDVHVSPITDELGMLLGSLNETFLQDDNICKHLFNSSPFEAIYMRSLARATRLQKSGFIQKDLDLPGFIANAIIGGSTEPAILVGLLLRGSLELMTENCVRRVDTAYQKLLVQNGHLKCQSCRDYRLTLIEEKLNSVILKSENDRLKDECRELSLKAIHEDFSHWQKLLHMRERFANNTDYLNKRIDRIMECLVIISKTLNDFPNTDLFVGLVKLFVQDSFVIIGAMNYFARNPYLDA